MKSKLIGIIPWLILCTFWIVIFPILTKNSTDILRNIQLVRLLTFVNNTIWLLIFIIMLEKLNKKP